MQQFALQRGDTVVETGKIGDIRVLAKSKAGVEYTLSGASCKRPGIIGCEVLFIQVRYAATHKVTDASLAAANLAFATLKVWEDKAHTTVGVSRDVMLRDGVTRQNVLDNIAMLVGMAPAAARIAFGSAPAEAATASKK